MSSNHFLNACPAHTSTSTRISLLCFLFFLGKDWDSKSTAHIPSGGIFLIYAFSCKNPSSRAFHCRRVSFSSNCSIRTKACCLVSGSACPHLVLSSACTPLLPPLPPWALNLPLWQSLLPLSQGLGAACAENVRDDIPNITMTDTSAGVAGGKETTVTASSAAAMDRAMLVNMRWAIDSARGWADSSQVTSSPPLPTPSMM